ncbi:hypothetical protein [Burkholderia sp. MSMB1498]|uniref:hypothetical protein n=1 Tax=Burkholderia sp. MSMB1498 TaxID=1637842 RepID=UPI0012E3E90A|nr:hypothetical protein [Burkholderia sp. MSMB1498]
MAAHAGSRPTNARTGCPTAIARLEARKEPDIAADGERRALQAAHQPLLKPLRIGGVDSNPDQAESTPRPRSAPARMRRSASPPRRELARRIGEFEFEFENNLIREIAARPLPSRPEAASPRDGLATAHRIASHRPKTVERLAADFQEWSKYRRESMSHADMILAANNAGRGSCRCSATCAPTHIGKERYDARSTAGLVVRSSTFTRRPRPAQPGEGCAFRRSRASRPRKIEDPRHRRPLRAGERPWRRLLERARQRFPFDEPHIGGSGGSGAIVSMRAAAVADAALGCPPTRTL